MKALSIDVYRRNGVDCTNGGISGKYNTLLVLCDDGNVTIDPDNLPENLVKVVHRHLFGRDVYHIEPVVSPTGAGWMAGGNYAASCDSRFNNLIGNIYGAVSVHDRQESWEMYDMLSH